jgi:protein-L-isoaspartate(D-aspartate) O-methyltransferase
MGQMRSWFSRANGACEAGEKFARQRERMVQLQLVDRGIRDERVLRAMAAVPREQFMPPHDRGRAYEDGALGIGHGQTISQPYMVAIMSQCLALGGSERVLEIGTGSGYQAAVLAELVRAGSPDRSDGHVYTIERLAELSERARATLERLGYQSVSYRVGDGSIGWPEAAPFDAILLTAHAPAVPDALLDQLADGGRFVGPIGGGSVQTLTVCTKTPDGRIEREELTKCRFVPLIGRGGWRE